VSGFVRAPEREPGCLMGSSSDTGGALGSAAVPPARRGANAIAPVDEQGEGCEPLPATLVYASTSLDVVGAAWSACPRACSR